MKKILLSLVIGLFGAIGLMAQAPHPWTPATNEDYEDEMIIYAGLVNQYGPVSWAWETYIAAFINGECRGVAEFVNSTAAPDILYAPLRVAGNENDMQENITFKIYHEGLIYGSDEVVQYISEWTVGSLSHPLAFSLNTPSYYTYTTTEIELTVGESVDLSQFVQWHEPDNPSVPEELPWHLRSETMAYMPCSLQGNTLTANVSGEAYVSLTHWKPYDGNFEIKVIIKEPEVLIESITILPEFQNGVEVWIDEVRQLNLYLDDCYTLNPANTTETPVWSCSDPEAIVYETPDGVNFPLWVPKKPGVYTMTLTAQNCSAQLQVTIKQHVEGIALLTKYLYVMKGQNLNDFLPYAYRVLPMEAYNQEVYVEVENPEWKTVIDENTLEALEPGEATLVIYSLENPEISNRLPVVVNENCTIEIWSDLVTVPVEEFPAPIGQMLWGNAHLLPWTPDVQGSNQLDWEFEDPEIVSVEWTYDGISSWSDIIAHKPGTTKATVTHWYTQSVLGKNGIQEQRKEISASFMVKITVGPSSISLVGPSQLSLGEPATYTIVTVPEDAELESFAAGMNYYGELYPYGWEMYDVEIDEKSFTITPKAVGNVDVNLYTGRFSTQTINANVGQKVHPEVGWKWVSLNHGSLDFDQMHDAYGDNLSEIRSQSQLLANDAEYGYFGDLNEMLPGVAYKVALKAAQPDFTVPYSVAPAETNINLKKTWTWIGCPYQYDHELIDALQNAVKYDRIVSKSQGFAEYDGKHWVGTLSTLESGLAYLYYNGGGTNRAPLTLPIETSLGQQPVVLHAPARQTSVWQYDESQWADNMSIIAVVDGIDLSQGSYTVGAMVDGECRGEGQVVDGYLFITVHGKSGEQITFCLYDADTESYIELKNHLQLGMMAGSLEEPVMMQAAETNGIQLKPLDAADQQVYDLYGRRIKGNDRPAGFYIVK